MLECWSMFVFIFLKFLKRASLSSVILHKCSSINPVARNLDWYLMNIEFLSVVGWKLMCWLLLVTPESFREMFLQCLTYSFGM